MGWAPFRKTHLASFGAVRTKEANEWTAVVDGTYSLYGRRKPQFTLLKTTSLILVVFINSKLSVGAYLLCPRRSTIGDGELNCRIRNENGWTLSAKAPTLSFQ